MRPDSCRSPACADKKSAVSSPSGDAAPSDDDEFRVVVAKLAIAWPLPHSVHSGILAMLDALQCEGSKAPAPPGDAGRREEAT